MRAASTVLARLGHAPRRSDKDCARQDKGRQAKEQGIRLDQACKRGGEREQNRKRELRGIALLSAAFISRKAAL